MVTVTDQFCGAGGSSTGAAAVPGVEIKMAMNHWSLAIETHNTNHPNTDHDCADMSAVDPWRYPSTDILITSPECPYHSIAQGKKRKKAQLDLFVKTKDDPAAIRSRATMWDVVRFTEYHKYNFVIVENVVEVRKWVLWSGWLNAMISLGYNHKCVYLNSRFFPPCPQSRDRIYVVFWKKGNKAPDLEHRPIAPCQKCGDKEAYQWWKKQHKKAGKYGKAGQYYYRCSECKELVVPYYHAAFNCIDWSIPGNRVGDSELKPNTMRRIKHGVDKYGRENMIITPRYTYGLDSRVRKASDRSLPTQTGDIKSGILLPFVFKQNQSNPKNDKYMVRSSLDSLGTQTTRQCGAIVLPFMVDLKGSKSRPKLLQEPISTVQAKGNHHMLVNPPFIVENYKQSNSKPITKPLGAQTTRVKHAIVVDEKLKSFLNYYYGNDQFSSMTESVGTFSTRDRMGLATPNGPKVEDCYYRMLRPHEIQYGMSFPNDYIILGNSRDQVRQLGNAVTPPVMTWLVQRCVDSLRR